jgi:DNA helicase-2/ATP-dependent DNA helicase PcrA
MVEKVIRSAANVDDEDETALDERWLRDAAYRLAASLDPAGSTAKVYAQKVRDYVKQIPWPAGITPKDNLGAFLKAPPDPAWPAPEEAAAGFPFATIHSVKGREFATAVVALPQNLRTDPSNQNVLDHWEHGKDTEARRVFYVGASRAQKLLILAVHSDHANRVEGLLKRDGVPYDLARSAGRYAVRDPALV